MGDESGQPSKEDEDSNFISCLCWAPKGFAKQKPERIGMDDVELKDLMGKQKGEEEDSEPKQKKKKKGKAKEEATNSQKEGEDEDEDVIEKYGLDDYDDSDAEDQNPMASIARFASNDEDPYITLKDADESDDEDDEILPSDSLALAAHVNGQSFSLQVHLYNAQEEHSFVHRDFFLPTLPICVEWIGEDLGGGEGGASAESGVGNFLAAGYMSNVIDIWDLDFMEPLEPTFQLGNKRMKKKKKKKAPQTELYGHSDAVLTMAWNRHLGHLLASGSADFTIELWDLNVGKPGADTVTLHEEKVQTLDWHPKEPTNLLSGACDKTARLLDCRDPNNCSKTWSFPGEVEKVLFDRFSPWNFYVASDDGMLYSLDVRKEKPLFTLAAHTDAITALSLSPEIPYCCVTASMDKTVKVWDLKGGKPECVVEKNFKIGPLHCAQFCPDAPMVVAVGGNKGCFKLWDAKKAAAVKKRWRKELADGEVEEEEEEEEEETTVKENEESTTVESEVVENGAGDAQDSKDGGEDDWTDVSDEDDDEEGKNDGDDREADDDSDDDSDDDGGASEQEGSDDDGDKN